MSIMKLPNRVAILAFSFHPLDARLLRQRRSLQEAGFDAMFVAPATSAPSAPDVHFASWGGECAKSYSRLARLEALGAGLASTILRGPELSLSAVNEAARGRLAYRARTRALVQMLVSIKPNSILVADPESLPAAVQAKARTGARLIYDAHELHEEMDPEDIGRRKWVRRIETEAAPHLDSFVTVNVGIARQYEERQPFFPKATIIHNAQPETVRPSPDGRLRDRAGLRSDTRVVLYQGGMTKLRGLDRLIACASLLPPAWAIVMMGYGPLRDVLEQSSDPQRVRFLPPVPQSELGAWTVEGDLGAILYEDVGLNQRHCTPNKLWEYPAARVPILGSDLPEMKRIAGNAGFWVSPNATPETIATQIATITPRDMDRARTACDELTEAMSWESEAEKLLHLCS